MKSNSNTTFGFFRRNFFPVHFCEVKKIAFLNVIFFCVAGNYAILRGCKDVFIIGKGGGDLISKVKLFGVIPVMMIFKLLYDYMSKRVSSNNRFFVVIAYFTCFFLAYLLIFQHFGSTLQNPKEASLLQQFVAFWPYILFYVHAEAWGTFGLSVGCWTFVNQITESKQAKRFYTLLMFGSSTATFFGGLLLFKAAFFSVDMLITIVLVFFVILAVVYHLFLKEIKADPEGYQIPQVKKKKKKKKKLGVIDSIKALVNSENSLYLGLILALVLCYALGINLFEGVYKDYMKKVGKEVLQDPNYVRKMIAYQLMGIGLFSLFLIFFTSGFVTKFGWRFTALIVPVVFATGTFLFFVAMYFSNSFASIAASLRFDYIQEFIVWVGCCIVVFIKSAKYIFFDTTKESTYIPLDEESKVTGKSAVDGLGSRVGKGAGSFVIYVTANLIMGIESYYRVLAIKNVLVVIIFAVSIVWIFSVLKLSGMYSSLLKKEAEVKKKGEEDEGAKVSNEKNKTEAEKVKTSKVVKKSLTAKESPSSKK